MAQNIYNANAAQSTIDNLMMGTQVFVKTVEGKIAAYQDWQRGLPLAYDPATGLWDVATTQIDGILLDTLEQDQTVFAVALTGEFNENVMDISNLTDAPASIAAARKQQIYIAPMHQAPYVQIGE